MVSKKCSRKQSTKYSEKTEIEVIQIYVFLVRERIYLRIEFSRLFLATRKKGCRSKRLIIVERQALESDQLGAMEERR